MSSFEMRSVDHLTIVCCIIEERRHNSLKNTGTVREGIKVKTIDKGEQVEDGTKWTYTTDVWQWNFTYGTF